MPKTRGQRSGGRRYLQDSPSSSQGLGQEQLNCIIFKQCSQVQEIRLEYTGHLYTRIYLSFPWILLNFPLVQSGVFLARFMSQREPIFVLY
jgi:hypothetical protein